MASLAQRENIPYVLSTMATSTIEEIGAVAPDVAWFQLYVSKNDDISADLLKRAWAVGMRVLVLTVDVPHPGRRNRSIRDQFVLPFRYTPRVVAQLATHPAWSLSMLGHAPVLKNYASYTDTKDVQGVARFVTALNKFGLDWDDFQRARDRWKGTLVVKGVQETDDAAEMIRRGADSIWVSNHGGRQLESALATIDTLAAIKGVAGTKPVLFDSGIRSGEDILKARALGADMTFAGRAFIYGAAAAGPAGIEAAYDILSKETAAGLGQIGCPSIAALNKSWLAA
jgi:(S)-mandelate dehydrogenase